MSKINLLTLQAGDSQATLIDKINYNNDQILTVGGGPQGMPGRIGITGPPGPQGEIGVAGPQGQEGSKWFVSASGPTSGSPLGIPISGDYWLRDADKEILRYGISGTGLGWVDSGYNLRADQLFSTTGSNWNTSTSSFDSDVTYYSQEDAGIFSLLLSDWGVNGTGTNYAGSTLYGLNSEKSKFKIATSLTTTYSNLISFGRVDLDSANSASSTFSNTHNPVIKWSTSPGAGATAGTPNIWDVRFYNPIGSWDIITTGGNIGFNSNGLNKIETSGLTGGTIVNFASLGYFQVLPSGSTGSSSTPYFSVNATGAGIKTTAIANTLAVKGSASFALNDSYNNFGLSGGYVSIEKGLRIAATGAAANNLTVKGSGSIGQTDSYNSFAMPAGYFGVESGFRVGATGFNPYGIPSGTGPGATGYLLGATEAYTYTGSTGTFVTPKVLISGQGNGAVFQSRLDNPTGPNALLSWGDSTIYPFNNSIINNLSQEYVSATGPIPTGTFFAGYYHGASNPTGIGSYSSASPTTPDPITQYEIVSQYGVGTHMTTAGNGDVLNLFSRLWGPSTTGARVVLGVNGTNVVQTYQTGVRINGQNSIVPDGRTNLSVEDDYAGQGAYFGPRATTTPAWQIPSAITYWPTGCQPTPAPFGSINRVKVVGDSGGDGMNGINIAKESDSTPTGIVGSTTVCFTGSKGTPKALTITDYDHYTRNGNTYATITWDGKITLGKRSILTGGTSISNVSFDSSLNSYGPDTASLFTYGDISCNGTVRSVGGFASSGFFYPSSRKLKDSIEPLTLGLDQLAKLNPVSFNWKKDGRHDIGFIAEEVFEIIPEAVSINKDGEVEGYDPGKIIPILTKSVQELMEQVAELRKEIQLLKQK